MWSYRHDFVELGQSSAGDIKNLVSEVIQKCQKLHNVDEYQITAPFYVWILCTCTRTDRKIKESRL